MSSNFQSPINQINLNQTKDGAVNEGESINYLHDKQKEEWMKKRFNCFQNSGLIFQQNQGNIALIGGNMNYPQQNENNNNNMFNNNNYIFFLVK